MKHNETTELIGGFLEDNCINCAVINEDIVISTDNKVLDSIVKKALSKGASVKIGNLLEFGYLSLCGKARNNVMVINQNVVDDAEEKSSYSMLVATKNADDLKKYISDAVDRYVSIVGRGFSRFVTPRNMGSMKVNCVVNNKKLKEVTFVTETEALRKEELIISEIDKASNNEENEF